MMLAGQPLSQRKLSAETVLELVGLSDRSGHRPAELSGGQLQRVAIARAIVMKPKILLADEPTGNLDQASGKEIVDVLETLNQEGITLIVVTHDLDLGKRAARRIRMVDGAIVEDVRSGGVQSGDSV